jgi:hypothetical protein
MSESRGRSFRIRLAMEKTATRRLGRLLAVLAREPALVSSAPPLSISNRCACAREGIGHEPALLGDQRARKRLVTMTTSSHLSVAAI